MEVSAWCNGKTTFGIRVGARNRAHFFAPHYRHIEVEIDGQRHAFDLTSGFWKKCPEFRDTGSTPIRSWLAKYHTTAWARGKPPRFDLHHLGENRYRLGN